MCMQPEGPFCQSCSMPLSQSDLKGTEADGSKSEKYCAYCYQHEAFVDPDMTLTPMIDVSAQGWVDQDPNLTVKQAKARLAQILPHLERWR